MSYFDSKEDVLDLQLTQYGKLMLQRGKFRPHYYCFFDDEVLYDTKYQFTDDNVPANYVDEAQGGILDRIWQTPRNRTQHIYYGAETSVNDRNLEYDLGRSFYDPKENRIRTIDRTTFYDQLNVEPNPTERNKALGYKIYSGPLGLDKSPNIILKTNKNHFKVEETQYLTQSVSGLPIPQISASVATVFKQENIPHATLLDPQSQARWIKVAQNQSLFTTEYDLADRKIKIDPPSLYLELNEQNSFYQEENYDLEVFYVRERVTEEGQWPYIRIDFDETSPPANGQYLVLTGSTGLKVAFEVGASSDNGAHVGNFEDNELCPKYRVRSAATVNEFVTNLISALVNHVEEPFSHRPAKDLFTIFPNVDRNIIVIKANDISKKAETIVRVNMNNSRVIGRTSQVESGFKILGGFRAPTIEEYLVPLRFGSGIKRNKDRWDVDFNFHIVEDDNVPNTYPKYFDMHTKMSIFAKRHEDHSRPKANINDTYQNTSFDSQINDCEE